MPFTLDVKRITPVILAGGFGTRLRKVVPDCQKVLAAVKGRPFITYLLDQINFAGFEKVVLCTGYGGEKVRETFQDVYKNLSITYSQESQPLGTAGALRLALPCIASETVMTMNGDSFLDIALFEYISWHFRNAHNTSIVVVKMPDTGRYGRVEVGEKSRVSDFKEKKSCVGPGWINAGIYLFRRSAIEDIPSGRAVSLEKEVFPGMIGGGIYAYQNCGRFIDIGTPESYRVCHEFFGGENGSQDGGSREILVDPK